MKYCTQSITETFLTQKEKRFLHFWKFYFSVFNIFGILEFLKFLEFWNFAIFEIFGKLFFLGNRGNYFLTHLQKYYAPLAIARDLAGGNRSALSGETFLRF
jgi:hypothetical protein